MASDTRDKMIALRLSQDEIALVKHRAAESKMTPSEYMRFRLLAETPVAFVEVANLHSELDGLQNAITRAQQALGNTTPPGES